MPKAIVVPDLIRSLPFHSALSWEDFQLFCTDLIYKVYNCSDSREYLSKGNSQHGIDVYAKIKGEDKFIVAQCKLKKYLGPTAFEATVDEFLKGDFVLKTKEFILCTNVNLNKQKDEEITIQNARSKLRHAGVELKVWDEGGLATELRTNTNKDVISIVCRYFGTEITREFYGDIWKNFINTLGKVEKKKYKIVDNYIERTIKPYEGKYEIYQSNYWWLIENQRKETLKNLFELAKPNDGLKIILLSIAGFGKSLEINQMAGYFSDDDKFYHPIKLSLRNYNGQTIESWLDNFNEDWKNIGSERILLLFDGLDEISENKHGDFIRSLNSFVEIYEKVSVFITSRFNSYNLKHEPLTGFQVYVLDPLTFDDIEFYLDSKLENKSEFKDLVVERKFSEFNQNPYYLTRMVRFFNSEKETFPKNKSELFERILFEQLDKDEVRYQNSNLKKLLLPIAKQIAFCMTLSGKSSLNNGDVEKIVPDLATKLLLKKFCILLNDEMDSGSWTFEHKNLQEYLCASCFVDSSFDDIHKIISFQFDARKLLPHFLNTVSFLFEIINKETLLFKELFEWICTNEPELFIRFEKEQISKETRLSIFREIFHQYRDKDMPLRVTSNFSLEELANFIGIDEVAINFLSTELESKLPQGLVFDSLVLLSKCKQGYLYRELIDRVIFTSLNNHEISTKLHAACIDAIETLGFKEESQFQKIIETGVSTDDFDVRRAIIKFLVNTPYFEKYIDLILGSILIFETGQRTLVYGGSNKMLSDMILSCNDASSIKKILQYFINDIDCISHRHHQHKFQFDPNELKRLFNKAKNIFYSEKSIVRVIYRLFRKLQIPFYDRADFEIFRDFFNQTCGTDIIFAKLFRYDKEGFNFLAFSTETTCSYLLSQYHSGNISELDITRYRNSLSHYDYDLAVSFHGKLLEISSERFYIEDWGVDYNAIRLKREEKNRKMLLDKNLFFDEVDAIFKIISKESIAVKDLWFGENKNLRIYQNSLAFETIRDFCRNDDDKIITKSEFVENYVSEQDWEWFVIGSIKEQLKNKSNVDGDLISHASKWCFKKIEELNFENCIVYKGNNTLNYIPVIEFTKELFLLLQIELEDSVLIEMLQTDYNSFYFNENCDTISKVVMEKVKDRALLKTSILDKIANGNLSLPVLFTYYQVCHTLSYSECCNYLYNTIVSGIDLSDDRKIRLTKYYIELGGKIEHFKRFLSVPNFKSLENTYETWHWHLIEEFRNLEVERVTEMLLEILNSPEHCADNKIKSCEQLILLSNIEGLKFWVNSAKQNENGVLFENRWESLSIPILKMPLNETTDLILDVLRYVYENGLDDFHKRPFGLKEMVHNLLFSLAIRSYENYNLIKIQFDELAKKYSHQERGYSIKIASERLTQTFFEKQTPVIDILQANQVFIDKYLSFV